MTTIYPVGVWLVLKVEDSPENLVRLDGKVKFREGTVVFAGSRNAATAFIYDKTRAPGVLWVNLTGGDFSTLTGGYESTLTGGYESTLTGGNFSTLTGGDGSTLTWKVWDGLRYRLHTFYTGFAGIKANTPYRFTDGKIKEVIQ